MNLCLCSCLEVCTETTCPCSQIKSEDKVRGCLLDCLCVRRPHEKE